MTLTFAKSKHIVPSETATKAAVTRLKGDTKKNLKAATEAELADDTLENLEALRQEIQIANSAESFVTFDSDTDAAEYTEVKGKAQTVEATERAKAQALKELEIASQDVNV